MNEWIRAQIDSKLLGAHQLISRWMTEPRGAVLAS